MSSPYMPLFVADYLADTAHLSAAEHGAYLLLIMNYWQRAKPLPGDDRKLARIARMSDAEWADAKPNLVEFFQPGDDEWRHARIDEELSVAQQKSAKAKASARASVIARRASAEAGKGDEAETGDHPQGERSTDAERTLSERSTDAELLGKDRIVDTASAASTARAGLSYDQIEAQCRKAAGLDNDPSPALLDLSPILQLMDRGADLERNILPVIRSKARPGVRSWKFFVPAVVEAMSPAKGVAEIRPPAPPIPDEDRWASSMKSHANGIWSDHWGPEPGRPGCRIPDAFVARWRRENGMAAAA